MKKQIAVIMEDMNICGVPKACTLFLKQIADVFDVSLIIQNTDGPFMKDVPSNVHIIKMSHLQGKEVISHLLKRMKLFSLAKFIVKYCYITKVKNNPDMATVLLAKTMGIRTKKRFDCAISYHGIEMSHNASTLYSVDATKKVAWIHGAHSFSGISKDFANAEYCKFDKIYCVSNNLRTRFLNDFPDVHNSTDVILNYNDVDSVKKSAKEYCVKDYKKENINIVTVGRLSPVKGQSLIPETVYNLKKAGYPVKWFIVGDGSERKNIESLCASVGVVEDVVFVGFKNNPYPYISNCDLYVQPSFSEGYCLTVCEAAILGKPIVLTEIAAADILENQKNAVVVKPTVDSLTKGIVSYLEDENLQQIIQTEISKIDLSNTTAIHTFIDYVNQ